MARTVEEINSFIISNLIHDVLLFKFLKNLNMKSLYFLTLIFLCISANATTIYVSTTGNDATGNGTSGNPYATLHKASTLAVNGDIIHINAGHYTENNQCTIATGVSIEGADSSTTFITTSYVGGSDGNAFLMFSSASAGTNGNQHVSNISFNGNNLTSDRFAYVYFRDNVEFNNVSIKHFSQYGIYFRGSASAYSTGCSVYNCTISDCAPTHSAEGGVLWCLYTDGLLIHNNILSDTSRTTGNNGNIFHGASGSSSYASNRGLKFYYNTTYKPLNDNGNAYNSTLEFWYAEGIEIYGNTFNGGGYTIDDGGTGFTLTGTYPYKFYIHDNIFQQSQQVPNSTGYFAVALNNESGQGRDWFINNKVINYPTGAQFIIGYVNGARMDGDSINNNYFINCGYSDGTNNYHGIISMSIYINSFHAHNDTISNTFIYNNTFYTSNGSGKARGILPIENDTTNSLIKGVYFRNNIVDSVAGAYGYIVYWENQTNSAFGLIDSIFSDHNIVFGNANSNSMQYRSGTYGTRNGTNVTHVTETAIIKSNPELQPDYSITAGSPAIGTGINYGYGSDIGAYQYGSITPTLSWPFSNLTYPAGLGPNQLNAVAMDGASVVTGVHHYAPGSGTVGNVPSINVTDVFNPTDSITYSTVSKTVTIPIAKQTVSLVFSNLSRQYTGAALLPTLTATPNVSTSITLNGVTGGKINAGTYTAVGGVTDPNSMATPITATFTITKAPMSFVVTNTSFTYDSLLHTVSVATNPAGLSYTVTGGPYRYKGTYQIILQNTDANHTALPDTVTMTINAGTAPAPNWAPANMTYNAAIGSPQTNGSDAKGGSYVYTPTTGFIPPAGTLAMRMDFYPTDTNLAPILATIRNITVSKGTDVISVADTIQSADGSIKTVHPTTLHGGTLTVNYTGGHTAIGDYPFTVTYADPNWQATTFNGTLHIISNPASIFITNYSGLVFDSLPQVPSVNCPYSYTLAYSPSDHTHVRQYSGNRNY